MTYNDFHQYEHFNMFKSFRITKKICMMNILENQHEENKS